MNEIKIEKVVDNFYTVMPTQHEACQKEPKVARSRFTIADW